MRSYLGALVPNFPNAFLITGPNTGIGHTSQIYMIESSIRYIISVIDHVEKSGAAEFEVKEKTVADFEDEIARRSEGTIWTSGGCDSWYLDESGRNTVVWPDFSFHFRKLCRAFDQSQITLRTKGEPAPPLTQAAGTTPTYE